MRMRVKLNAYASVIECECIENLSGASMHGWSRIKTSVTYPTESEKSYAFTNIIASNTFTTSSNVLSVVYAHEALVVLFSVVFSDLLRTKYFRSCTNLNKKDQNFWLFHVGGS
jgi:hypothetical protein